MYPDTAGPDCALEAEDWFEGKNGDPILISLKHGYIPGKNRDLKVVKKNVLENKPTKKTENTVPAHKPVSTTPSIVSTPHICLHATECAPFTRLLSLVYILLQVCPNHDFSYTADSWVAADMSTLADRNLPLGRPCSRRAEAEALRKMRFLWHTLGLLIILHLCG